ncbi:hypothetical protein U1Q18_017925 [Sarracenia purpurea var. burkii]
MAAVVELLAWYRSSPPPDTKWGHIFSEGDGVLVHPGNLEVKSFIPRKEESSIQSIFSDCKTFIDGGVKDDDENTDLNDYKGDEAVGGLDKHPGSMRGPGQLSYHGLAFKESELLAKPVKGDGSLQSDGSKDHAGYAHKVLDKKASRGEDRNVGQPMIHPAAHKGSPVLHSQLPMPIKPVCRADVPPNPASHASLRLNAIEGCG